MAARRCEISLRVLKNISRVSAANNMLFCTSEDIKFSRESSLGISLVFSYIIKKLYQYFILKKTLVWKINYTPQYPHLNTCTL